LYSSRLVVGLIMSKHVAGSNLIGVDLISCYASWHIGLHYIYPIFCSVH
jgi:hypothetical protein